MGPNTSVELTRYGCARLAFILFWAKRRLPQRSDHLKR